MTTSQELSKKTLPKNVGELAASKWMDVIRRRVLSFKLKEPLEDTLQDILIRMMRKKDGRDYIERFIPNERGSCSFGRYLCVVATNHCANELGKEIRSSAISHAVPIDNARTRDSDETVPKANLESLGGGDIPSEVFTDLERVLGLPQFQQASGVSVLRAGKVIVTDPAGGKTEHDSEVDRPELEGLELPRSPACLVRLRMLGLDKQEIMNLLGVNATKYHKLSRRVRQFLEQHGYREAVGGDIRRRLKETRRVSPPTAYIKAEAKLRKEKAEAERKAAAEREAEARRAIEEKRLKEEPKTAQGSDEKIRAHLGQSGWGAKRIRMALRAEPYKADESWTLRNERVLSRVRGTYRNKVMACA